MSPSCQFVGKLSVSLALVLMAGCATERLVRIKNVPPGAKVTVTSGRPLVSGVGGYEGKQEWNDSRDAREFVVQCDGHEEKRLKVLGSTAEAYRKDDVIELDGSLDLLADKLQVSITSSVPEATVKINGEVVGKTPMAYDFAFQRPEKKAAWNTFKVEVEKDGYRLKTVDKSAPGTVQSFSAILGYDEAKAGKLNVDLEPVKFVSTPIVEMKPSSEGMVVVEQKVLSQVGDIEREPKVGGATRITDFEMDLVKKHHGRISATPDSLKILYSLPNDAQAVDALYFNLWLQGGNQRARTRITDANQQDLEATVSPDGQWFYFSSDRLIPGRYNLWRTPAIGRGGLTKITDSPSSIIDTEPTVSPNNKQLAFTSFLRGAKQPQVWIANSDGSMPTQIRSGHSPAWSPDGAKLAYIAPDTAGHEKVWVMDNDGSAPTQLTTGDHIDAYPSWTPDGKRIVFASDQAVNGEGVRNFDLWIMNADGSNATQLTVNGSYDTRPAITPDGKYVYFYSNRGARKTGEPAMQIWRIELPKE